MACYRDSCTFFALYSLCVMCSPLFAQLYVLCFVSAFVLLCAIYVNLCIMSNCSTIATGKNLFAVQLNNNKNNNHALVYSKNALLLWLQ
jgi:Ca2+/Na+ antiporter